MITKEQAIESVRVELKEDMDIMLDSIIEKDYGWVIFSQSKKYIETRNPLDALVGSGGALVEKDSGRKIEFGSAYSLEKNLEIYEKGYLLYDNWDIVVTRVNDLRRTIDSLSRLRITYIEPEETHGKVWKIPKQFTYKQFKSSLLKLPVRFNLGYLYFQFDVLESFKQQQDFIYTIEENIGFINKI